MTRPRTRAPRLRKEHRQIARDLDCMGFDTGLTEKNHLRFTHRATGRVIYGPGTPSDHRSYKNVMAQVRRFIRDET